MSDATLETCRAIMEAEILGGAAHARRTGSFAGSTSAHAMKVVLLAVALHGRDGQAVLTHANLCVLTGLSSAAMWKALSTLCARGLVSQLGTGAWAADSSEGGGGGCGLDARGRRLRGCRYRVESAKVAELLVPAAALPRVIEAPVVDPRGLALGPVVLEVLKVRERGIKQLGVDPERDFRRGPHGQLSLRGSSRRSDLAKFMLGEGVPMEQVAAALSYASSSSISQLVGGKKRKAQVAA